MVYVKRLNECGRLGVGNWGDECSGQNVVIPVIGEDLNPIFVQYFL